MSIRLTATHRRARGMASKPGKAIETLTVTATAKTRHRVIAELDQKALDYYGDQPHYRTRTRIEPGEIFTDIRGRALNKPNWTATATYQAEQRNR